MAVVKERNFTRVAAPRLALKSPVSLLLPVLIAYAALLVAPLFILILESLRPYEAGRVGGQDTGWTFSNYLGFAHIQYAYIFWETIRLSFISSTVALFLAFPLAYHLTRTASQRARRAWMTILTLTLFLDTLIRCYALFILFGPVSPLQSIFVDDVGLSQGVYLRIQIVIGLLSFSIPISVLALLGPLQNINPRLREAALTLGCSYFRSCVSIDLRLAMPAVVATFFLTFTHSLTAFTVPMILGKGFVSFVSNVIYSRFSETADFPGGAAFSVLALLFSLTIVLIAASVAARTWRPA